MNKTLKYCACAVSVLLTLSLWADGQTRNRRPPAKSAASAKAGDSVVPVRPQATPPKRNERPDGPASSPKTDPLLGEKPAGRIVDPAYQYEFTQPEFLVSHVKVRHDENGAGTISFRKKGDNELITDPIRVSPKALARINELLNAMNFIDSTENYQYEKDFSHLGTLKFSLHRGGRSREVSYNWSENKHAKDLMSEYRRITNQFIWIFDITLSRENQPLEAPKLMDSLDSMIKRNEISDPHQLESFLRELSDDERIPLIARNHAAKIVKQFEKERAKEEKKRIEGS